MVCNTSHFKLCSSFPAFSSSSEFLAVAVYIYSRSYIVYMQHSFCVFLQNTATYVHVIAYGNYYNTHMYTLFKPPCMYITADTKMAMCTFVSVPPRIYSKLACWEITHSLFRHCIWAGYPINRGYYLHMFFMLKQTCLQYGCIRIFHQNLPSIYHCLNIYI